MMDEFDYLNGTLTEWLDTFVTREESTTIQFIEDEYLPRFEAAIYKNISRQMAGIVL